MSKPSKRKHDDTETSSNKKPKSGNKHWALGLLDSINDPELQVTSDDLCVVIKDKYPKAAFHYLVLPKDEISNLKKVNRDHVKLLEHMIELGKTITEKHIDHNFKFGYHAEASMHRLHMHIISDDMNSPCLKNKKHWNTFTTKFFISAEDIVDDLKENGKVTLPSPEKLKEYLNAPLVCHKCSFKPKNLPDLKKHILTHLKK
ncbi:uncharacterized protein CBL_02623 [Carabus blaptoides fortunei]